MSKFCGNCGNQAHDEAKICGYCGYRFPQAAQPVTPQPNYQQPAYQQPTYQQPVQQPANPFPPVGGQGSINPALIPKQGFPKSKIFVIIATLLQLFTTVIYFFETIVIETRYDKESMSFFEFMDEEDVPFLVVFPLLFGFVALVLNILTICLKKFGRYVLQIPQMIIAFLNFGLYTFLVFVIRDEIGYYDYFKEMIEDVDGRYSDGFVLMIIAFVAILALMITAAVFQGKEKKADRASMMRF